MRTWAFLLCGLLVWTVHFFALYIIASIWLTTPLARWLAGLATLVCFVALAALLHIARRRRDGDPLENWTRVVALTGIGIAAVAVLWQGLPVLLA